MNVDIILKMISPHVHSNCVTYEQFEKVFCMLSQKEKYVVLSILEENHIELVDELPVSVKDADYRIIKSNIDNVTDEVDVTPENDDVVFSDSIKQSNEILCVFIQRGDKQAAQDICVKNKRLVGKYAEIGAKNCHYKVEFDDLMQVGYMGLIKAAERFKPDLGFAFSTYATWWIRQAITREIMNSSYTIRVPVHMLELIFAVTKEEGNYLYMDPAERISLVAKNLAMTEEKVRECIRIRDTFTSSVSLNAPANEDEDSELGDLLPNLQLPSTEEVVMKIEFKNELDKILKTLTDREEKILRLRFGLDDGRERTLEEIGNIYGLTRERIRQIEEKALRKLRHPSRSNKIKGFFD